MHCDRMNQDGRLRVVRARELIVRTLPHHIRQRCAEYFVGFLESLARNRKRVGQILPHADVLRTLSGKNEGYQRRTEAPHVKPAPNATIRTLSPFCTRPCSIASSSAIGTVAELMFP